MVPPARCILASCRVAAYTRIRMPTFVDSSGGRGQPVTLLFIIPAGHSRQTPSPVGARSQYIPSPHGTHPVCAGFATVPGRHSRHTSPQPALGAYCPWGQRSQLLLPECTAWVPAEHFLHTSNMPWRLHGTKLFALCVPGGAGVSTVRIATLTKDGNEWKSLGGGDEQWGGSQIATASGAWEAFETATWALREVCVIADPTKGPLERLVFGQLVFTLARRKHTINEM
jgi:hypothetical protein